MACLKKSWKCPDLPQNGPYFLRTLKKANTQPAKENDMTIKTRVLATAMAAVFLAPAMAMAEDAPASSTAATSAPAAEAPMGDGMMGEGMMGDEMRRKMYDPKKNFAEADADKDGFLSLDEFLERHKKKFAEIDANKDGKISPEEMKERGEMMREKMHGRHERMMDKREDEKPAETPAK